MPSQPPPGMPKAWLSAGTVLCDEQIRKVVPPKFWEFVASYAIGKITSGLFTLLSLVKRYNANGLSLKENNIQLGMNILRFI